MTLSLGLIGALFAARDGGGATRATKKFSGAHRKMRQMSSRAIPKAVKRQARRVHWIAEALADPCGWDGRAWLTAAGA